MGFDQRGSINEIRSMTTRPNPWRDRIVLAGLLVACMVTAFSYGYCVQDDAFISYRYADNFARGEGLVYNPGERVEGYTNFLWTFGLAVAKMLGLNEIRLSVLVGLASAAGLIGLAFLVAREVDCDSFSPLLASAFVALTPAMALEAVQGLETTFFAFLVASTAYARLRQSGGSSRFPAVGILGALATLCRPEGLLVFAVVEAVPLLQRAGRQWRSRLRDWLVYAAIVGIHVGWRLSFYGELLPNTFFAKVGYTSAQVDRGFGYLWGFAREYPVLVILALMGPIRRSHRR